MSPYNSSTSSSRTESSSSSQKKLLRLFHLRDPAVQAHKKQFKWGSHLGSGTYGEVSKCVWLTHKPELDVAIKVVPKVKVPDKAQQERILARTSELKHDHIVSLFRWFQSRHHYYMVFELAPGGELFDHIMDHGRFQEPESRHMIRDLTSAISYIHSQNLVHRDLKPENLFVRGRPPFAPPYDLIIADFGVAVPLRSDDDQICGICGSPGYTAPEVYQKRPYGKPVDIWALGVITFILLCGRFPFANLQAQAFLDEIERNDRKDGRFPRFYGLSEEAENFIQRCLIVDPKLRMTADEALRHDWLTGKRHKRETTPSETDTETTDYGAQNIKTDDDRDSSDFEVITLPDHPSSDSPKPSQHETLAEVRFCRTRTISESGRSAM